MIFPPESREKAYLAHIFYADVQAPFANHFRSGVNFINVLLEGFSYESAFFAKT